MLGSKFRWEFYRHCAVRQKLSIDVWVIMLLYISNCNLNVFKFTQYQNARAWYVSRKWWTKNWVPAGRTNFNPLKRSLSQQPLLGRYIEVSSLMAEMLLSRFRFVSFQETTHSGLRILETAPLCIKRIIYDIGLVLITVNFLCLKLLEKFTSKIYENSSSETVFNLCWWKKNIAGRIIDNINNTFCSPPYIL